MTGESHGRHKVTGKQVAWMRRVYRPDLKGGGHHDQPGSIRHMAATVGLSRRQVMRIMKGENWRNNVGA